MCNTMLDLAAAAMALGKTERKDFLATLPATVVALANYCLYQLFSVPSAGAYGGAALGAVTVDGGTTPSITGGLLNFIDPTAPDRSYLSYGECLPQSATLGELIIYDLLAYYPGLDFNTGAAQVLTGAASVLPSRVANGKGAMFMLDVTTALGAGAATAVITYTNRSAVGGQTTPALTIVVSSPQGRIPHASYIIPLAAGDDGVQSAQGFDLSGAGMGAGVGALSIIKPLASIPIPANFSTTSGIGQRSWFVDPLEIDEILTEAALSAIFIPSAATASAVIKGHLKNVRFNPS